MVETTPDGSDGNHRLFATLMTVLLLGSVGLVAGAGTVAAEHDNGVGANYTVDLPNEKDHYPGEKGGKASIRHYATGAAAFEKQNAKGLEVLGYIVISSKEIDFSNCGTADTAAFGIDRGGDDPGTQTDEDLLRYREDSFFKQNKIVVDFYDKDDGLGSETVHLNKSDQIVAAQNGCYVMPSEPGWYQINSRINGTTYKGNELDETGITSHYFYVCECANEKEAREKLGPPPSEGGDATSTPKSTDSGTSTPKSTDSSGTSTPKSTDSSTTGTSQSTASTTSQSTASTTGTGQSTTGTTGTASSATTTGGSNAQQATPSPSSGNGPGFGLIAAVLALVAVAALAVRER